MPKSISKFRVLQLVVVVSAISGGCMCNDANEGTVVQIMKKTESPEVYRVSFWKNGTSRRAFTSEIRPLQGRERLVAKKKFENSSMYKYATI
jgi:ribosomal protein L19